MLLLILQGCAVVLPPEMHEDRLERFLAAEDYRAALDLLDNLESARFEPLLERKPEIAAAANRAGREVLGQAERLAADGDLALALVTLRQARDRLPDDPRLERQIELLTATRTVELEALNTDYLRLEAASLLERQRLIESMSRLATGPGELPMGPEELQREARALARALDARAATHEDPAERQALLQLAQALVPSEQRAQTLAALQPSTPAPARDTPASPTVADLQQALAGDDLESAQRICTDAARAGTDGALAALCQDIEQRLAMQLEAWLEEGRRLYATGDIDAAIDRWRRGHELAPEHAELQAALERAERVQERLESLRDRNAAVRTQ
ncbi:hypothetical protein TVNIR_0249 [Thioalkalivibrio nitratireducens DSM 14787]|uniref:Uncharacterized protein n=1 Tax=Thioalkalivibrio nitratireducens (strain DSM 14787 / UNIQEM 213 / ALEN2) TaxID=1255043 RepID=L0DSK4_THIND|nr:hypothetical protein TVNIR_0249 [Thioalkalivibrio nitratireducens DSM 14787]